MEMWCDPSAQILTRLGRVSFDLLACDPFHLTFCSAPISEKLDKIGAIDFRLIVLTRAIALDKGELQ
ncbi:MAG: hypothetical protein SAK29_09700 [Scytonema sp. PMC 1069.18]|nr:hypothetical protein [Scytonema sp. PMC 1069.18]MEC4887073.1 hypothetical protein [Scytonema sp. PMC 1070.18]